MKKIAILGILTFILISCGNNTETNNKETTNTEKSNTNIVENKSEPLVQHNIDNQLSEKVTLTSKKVIKEKKELPWDGYLDINCKQFKNQLEIEECLGKKLDDLYTYRYKGTDDTNYHKINCEAIFNKKDYPGLEDNSTQYLNKCIENRNKDIIDFNKNKLKEDKIKTISPIEFCNEKYKSYINDDKNELTEKCEYSLAIKNTCTVFKDKNREERCNQIKENVEKYNQMQNDFINYSSIDL